MCTIPEEFCKVMKDFIADMMHTFPEMTQNLHPGMKDILLGKTDTKHIEEVFVYCQKIYPERFSIFYIKMMSYLQMLQKIQCFYLISNLKKYGNRILAIKLD